MSTSPSYAPANEATYELAGEYVLGTLSGQQRLDVEQRLAIEPSLQAAVQAWEARLLPLTALVPAVPPSARLWPRIARSLDALAPTALPSRRVTRSSWTSFWHSLALWRGLAATGFTAAALTAVVLMGQVGQITPPETRFMVVLVAPDNKAPGWVVQASTNQHVELIPLAVLDVPADKSLQFWTKADNWNAPVSLGLVQPGQRITVPLDALPALQNNQLFELTLEPRAGSPTGRPTGPIQFIGRAVKVL
ncbi:anti-sigma factor [Alcaligenaceae bacterium]|nr:anti-sigma factor [Alcaligenaceae bacterium]